MNSLPPLLSLKAFEAVARHNNIVAAAEELCVTRSAVSQQLKQLEDYLTLPLLERNNNKITLTAAGQAYAASLSKIFQDLRFATTQVLASKASNRVTINLPMTYALHWLIPKLQEFQQQHPNIELCISTPMREVQFEREDIDLAMHYGDNAQPNLTVERLWVEEWIPVCTPDYLKIVAKGKQCYIETQDYRKSTWGTWCKKYKQALPQAKQTLSVPHTLQVLQAALNGLGIACVPRLLIENDLQAGRLVLPFGKQPVKAPEAFYLLSRKTSNERAAVEKVREWLVKQNNY